MDLTHAVDRVETIRATLAELAALESAIS